MAQDVCVCDSVKVEEIDAAELPTATIALRLFATMLALPGHVFRNRIGFEQAAWDAFEAAKAFREVADRRRSK